MGLGNVGHRQDLLDKTLELGSSDPGQTSQAIAMVRSQILGCQKAPAVLDHSALAHHQERPHTGSKSLKCVVLNSGAGQKAGHRWLTS
jgi:hypothetical protein